MAHTSSPAHAHGKGHTGGGDHPLVGHLVPLSTLVLTGTVLIILTVITVALRYIDLGTEFNLFFALFVACIKATLVCLYFMHLRWDRPFNQLIFVGSIVFVLLLMAFTLMDTKQYQADLRGGNPSKVQDILNESAPTAPIAANKPINKPI